MGNLLPNVKSPCNLFLKFKGKVIPIIKEGQPVDIEFINRMESNDIFFALILKEDLKKWGVWLKNRFPFREAIDWFNIQDNQEVLKRIASYKSYAFDKIKTSPDEYDNYDHFFMRINQKFSQYVKDINLRWYFSRYWTDESFYHSAKVSYLLFLFIDYCKSDLRIDIREDKEKYLIQFSIIHNLETEKSIKENDIASERTINFLKEKKIILHSFVGDFLKEHSGFYKKNNSNSFSLDQLSFLYKSFYIVDLFEKKRANIHGGSGKDRIKKSFDDIKNNKLADTKIRKQFEKFLERLIFKI